MKINVFDNMVDERMFTKEDMHPLARKTMGEMLRKMRKLPS